ncbi:MAG TPA: hypothetical protein VHM91_22215, partial [Verrucomicrobiales bacterium]|nr:hypothetical protein [Verrucomicrobiales bacterium]
MCARLTFFLFVVCCLPNSGAEPLPGTQPLTEEGDLAAKMVQGIHRFLERETGEVTKARESLWKLDATSPEAWEKSIEQKRIRLRQLLGIVDTRSKPEMLLQTPGLSVKDLFADGGSREIAARMETGTVISRVEWAVFRALKAEGLLTDGSSEKTAFIVIPDCGFTAEQSFGMEKGIPPETQWANRLGGIGHPVIAMTLPSRRPGPLMPGGRQPMYSQREVLWRAGFEMGRTLVGYEVQKVLAAVDWLCAEDPKRKVGIIGTGDGGLIALLAAALDPRIESTGLEGSFGPMEEQWREPIDLTVFGLLKEFGAAELLAMISPRAVVIRNAGRHIVNYTGEGGGAPGGIREFTKEEIDREAAKGIAMRLRGGQTIREERPEQFLLYTLAPFVWYETNIPWAVPQPMTGIRPQDENSRQARLFNAILEDTQTLMRQAQQKRGEYWKDANF